MIIVPSGLSFYCFFSKEFTSKNKGGIPHDFVCGFIKAQRIGVIERLVLCKERAREEGSAQEYYKGK